MHLPHGELRCTVALCGGWYIDYKYIGQRATAYCSQTCQGRSLPRPAPNPSRIYPTPKYYLTLPIHSICGKCPRKWQKSQAP